MRKNIIKFLLASLLTINSLLNAQVVNTPDILPPTPQTFNFSVFNSEFTNTPSGEFTYDVPIHSIKVGDLSLPIGLSYRSGVKVDDLGSNTGMSWQLNGGGVVSRIVRDMPDETASKRWVPQNIHIMADAEKIKEAAIPGAYMDTEYDWFNFNVSNGFSGNFYLDESLNPIYSGDDYSITKINHTMSDGKKYLEFVITDKFGNKYYFGGQKKYVEETTLLTSTNSGVPYPHLIPKSATGWFLYKITSPIGQEIFLEYEPDSYTFFSSVDSSLNVDQTCACSPGGGLNYATSIVDSNTLSSVNGARLISINTVNENLVFSYDRPRNDITSSSLLTSIEVKNKNNQLIKRNDLVYQEYNKNAETYYFSTPNNTGYRYFLEEIRNNVSKEIYKFEYYSPENLPARFSLSTDYNGYFNGKDNSKPFPKVTDFNSAEIREMWPLIKGKIPTSYISANKDVDPTLVQIGNLKKIIYPTGGSSIILYEPNKTTKLLPSDNTAAFGTQLNLLCNTKIITETQPSFTSNGTPISFTATANSQIDCNTTVAEDVTQYSIIIYEDDVLKKDITWRTRDMPYFETDLSTCLAGGDDKFCPVETVSGKSYKIVFSIDAKLSNTFKMNAGFTSHYNQETTLVDKEVFYAGSRVQKITENNNEGKNYNRDFYYNTYDGKDNVATSINFTIPPRLFYTRNDVKNCNADCGCYNLQDEERVQCMATVEASNSTGSILETKSAGFTTNSLLSNFNNRSNKAYYSVITDVIKGKSVEENFYFDNNDNPPLTFQGAEIFNLPYSNASFFKQGKIEKKITYGFSDGNLERINTTNFHYSGSNNLIKSFVFYQNYPIPLYFPVPSTYIENISIAEYYNHFGVSKISILNKEEVVDNNTLYSITTNAYTNSNHKQVTSQKTTFPDMSFQETNYKYAHEKGTQKLIDANMVGIPLETETIKNGKKFGRSETKYEHPLNLFPSSVLSYNIKDLNDPFNNNPVATTEVTYDFYDDKGNILQYTTKSGISTAIIWGYNKTQPIAKIEGAKLSDLTQTQIDSIVNASNTDASQIVNNDETTFLALLDTFRKDLPAYQITTYSYDPLIGVRSITPPSGIREVYIYDTANRLKEVRDVNGILLKENEYHYKP